VVAIFGLSSHRDSASNPRLHAGQREAANRNRVRVAVDATKRASACQGDTSNDDGALMLLASPASHFSAIGSGKSKSGRVL